MEVDYEKIGLKVGLEIHQQLDTSAKLFCGCKPGFFKEEPEITFLRRLRPTQSELGQIDPVAYFEFQKGVKIRYEANKATSCLVEMDEEPPHPLNMEALEAVLTAALLMNSKPVDEIHVMRKTVVDGSNTTGFQRTCIVSLHGEIDVGAKKIPLEHISLEEDAARKTGDEEEYITRYRIDRLGIPLIEVTTAPVIRTPEEAGAVALAIGRILRATGKAKRGIGTIRQDLNVSIPDGALIEIKGVQELELVPLALEYEIQRQLNLIKICEKLRRRAVKEKQITEEFFDVTNVFKHTKSKVIGKALETGKIVLAVVLPGFKDLLKWELLPNLRLGTEMADRARFWGRVGGIFHTDEMPTCGVTAEEIAELRKALNAEGEDAVVFLADKPDNAGYALRAVVERAKEALRGVPAETRAATAEGTTRYMRPRPGAARMYPETDIPPVQIERERVERIRLLLPELPDRKLKRLMKEYGLNQKLAKQLLDSEYAEIFETVVNESKVSPTVIAAFLTETLKALKRDGLPTEKVTEDCLREIFRKTGLGELTKEALPDLVSWLCRNEDKTVQEAVENLNLETLSEKEIQNIINRAIEANLGIIKKQGRNAFGALMGIVMREVRGKASAEIVSRLLKKKLEQ